MRYYHYPCIIVYAIHRAQLLISLHLKQLSRSLCHVMEPSQSTSSSLARVVPTVADKLVRVMVSPTQKYIVHTIYCNILSTIYCIVVVNNTNILYCSS